ncbi:MAG: fecR family protein [Verrucomicrobiaceae bacterium]|nr:fecR family protein [Verrucomicrobiaceae bacterium]
MSDSRNNNFDSLVFDSDVADAEQVLSRHRTVLQGRFPLEDIHGLAIVHRRVRARRSKRAAIAIALLLVVAGVLRFDPTYRTEHFATAIGERREVALSDGSHITLNTNTALDLEWHLRTRRVLLATGQVLFDVEHARYRPFLVAAGSTQIRVVGTAFDVRREHDDVTVTVLRGKVAVRNANGDEALLTIGQRALSNSTGLGSTQTVDSAVTTLWRDGKLVFDRTPLREALAEIQRYSREPIVLGADLSLAEQRVSGVFAIDNASAVLDLLPQILPVALVHLAGGGVRVDSAPSAKPAQLKPVHR